MKIFHSDMTTDAVVKYKQLHPNKLLHGLISYGRRDSHHRNLMLSHRNMLDGLIMDSGTYTLNQNPKKLFNVITKHQSRHFRGVE